MAGTYTKGISKILSGVYSRIVAAINAVTAGTRGIVAYPFTADWGPVNELVTCSLGEFASMYHADVAVTGLTANSIYVHASNGRPQKVQAYRMAVDAAKTARAQLADGGMVLETLYPTTRAFTAVVKDGVIDGTKTVQLIENGLEIFAATSDTVAGLVEQINASDYIRVATAGEALPANNAGVKFENGSNGEAVTAANYTAFATAMEEDGNANAFALDGVTDEAIIATMKAWLSRVRSEGFYVTMAVGGPKTWDTDISQANAASIGYNNRAIVNVGNGCDGYTAAEMAIYVAARVAAVALNLTLTDETAPYKKVNKKLTVPQREVCKTKGTLVFVMNGDYVEIDEAVNTLTSPVDGEVKEFGKIRVSNTLDYITRDLEDFGNEYKKTKSNTPEARQAYATMVEESYLKPLASPTNQIIKSDYFYRPDPEYHGDAAIYKPAIDEAFFDSSITPNDSMERIYQKLGVNF